MELTNTQTRKEGDIVQFRIGATGRLLEGVICGIAAIDLPTIGKCWIVQLPFILSDHYPYSTVTVFECHII